MSGPPIGKMQNRANASKFRDRCFCVRPSSSSGHRREPFLSGPSANSLELNGVTAFEQAVRANDVPGETVRLFLDQCLERGGFLLHAAGRIPADYRICNTSNASVPSRFNHPFQRISEIAVVRA